MVEAEAEVEADISKFKKEVMEWYFAKALLFASLLFIPGKIQDRKITNVRVSASKSSCVAHNVAKRGNRESSRLDQSPEFGREKFCFRVVRILIFGKFRITFPGDNW